jgi:hypothetical protein
VLIRVFLTSALDGVSGQQHALAAFYTQRKSHRYPLERRLGGPYSRSGRYRGLECVTLGTRTSTLQPVASRCADCATEALTVTGSSNIYDSLTGTIL